MNVIFDMDGLMFDTEKVFVKAWRYAGEKAGLGDTGYMAIKTLGMNEEACKKVWYETFGERYHPEEICQYKNRFLSDYYRQHDVPVKKGLLALLTYLKENKSKMAVASSSSRMEVEGFLERAGVRSYFDAVVCGDMIERSKPYPDIYIKAASLLGESPLDCYALEDSKNGLLAAHRAGCRPVMIPDLWQPDEEILEILAGKFDDLLQLKEAFQEKRI